MNALHRYLSVFTNTHGTLTKYHAHTLTYVILLKKKKKNLCDSNYAISRRRLVAEFETQCSVFKH